MKLTKRIRIGFHTRGNCWRLWRAKIQRYSTVTFYTWWRFFIAIERKPANGEDLLQWFSKTANMDLIHSGEEWVVLPADGPEVARGKDLTMVLKDARRALSLYSHAS